MKIEDSLGIMTAPPAAIAGAADRLRAGELVAFPTETVYGLGADATNGLAVARIFEAKGRPTFNPLIVHVADTPAAKEVARFTPLAERLAEAFWPGPLTLVLGRCATSPIPDLVTAGLDTVAVRVPNHAVAQALLREFDRAIAAPSANRSGHVSPTRAEHVRDDLGVSLALILDGGRTHGGIESTVLDATGAEPVLLRPGAVTVEAIEGVLELGVRRNAGEGEQPRSPGQALRHYAPRARLRLDAHEVRPGEALLAFGPDAPPTSGPAYNISPRGDLVEAAANLFAALRALDAFRAETIAVMPIPRTGLGEAINDRLMRAAVR